MGVIFRRRLTLGLTIMLTSSVSFAVFCPPQYQEETVAPAFASASSAISAALTSVDTALNAEMLMYNQRLLSAIAVLTKQKAIAADQIADANRTAAQSTAIALNTMAQTERVKSARFQYGGEFGQGFNPCTVYAGRNQMVSREADMGPERRNRIMSEVISAPGRYVDPVQAQQVMATEHQTYFCTADQVKAGMCDKVGEMAGASLSAATMFEPTMEADKLYRAKVAFINNLVGLPDAPVPAAAANTQAAATYALAKAQKDALMSPAVTSLKELQLEYSGVTTAHGGSDIPVAVRMDREVKRYLGNTPEYESWAKVMSAQNQRGLLIEMLKVKALDLVLQERQYRQYERMEANLTVLVGGQLRKQADKAAAAADQAAREQVKAQIK